MRDDGVDMWWKPVKWPSGCSLTDVLYLRILDFAVLWDIVLKHVDLTVYSDGVQNTELDTSNS